MSVNTIAEIAVRLPFNTSKRLLEECQKKFLLPWQVIAISLGESLGEPVKIEIPESYSYFYTLSDLLKTDSFNLRHKPEQKKLFLLILSQIIKRTSPEKFAKVANTLRGTVRAYFGRTLEEVESTGSGHEAARIDGTEWFASVGNPWDRKQKILETLMRRLEFSPDYAWMISHVPASKQLHLRGIRPTSV